MDYKTKKKEENKTLIETLVADLNNEDWMVRERAVETLREIKDNRSIEPLIIALNDGDFDIQAKALMGLKEITGQEFGRDAEKWRMWWAKNSLTFKDNKASDSIEAKWLYNQVWKYHEHSERDNLLESLLLLAKSFPDSEETVMAFKSFTSSNYFNKEEQKKLRPLFNKYKEIENATCPSTAKENKIVVKPFKFIKLLFLGLSLGILFVIGVVVIIEIETNRRIENIAYFNNNSATILSEIRNLMSSKNYRAAESLSAKYLASDNEELLKLYFDVKWKREAEEAKARIDEIKRKPFNDRTAGEHAELAKDEYEHKSEYEKGMDLARELDRMNNARRLDDIARDRDAIDRYRQYK
ncbi:MAG: hypothetical protein CVV37_06840 [Nitrospira bacterium HGW-Nitrospira-1]|nr:MAG: hypothetical protein CVV37_06840 [Nitrospira bacterium HGW-Nitrospira-1]